MSEQHANAELERPRMFSADTLRKIGVQLFTACGASREEATTVANELVDASLMGLDSHGVMRYVDYIEQARNGKVKPGAPVRVVKETPSTAIVDCGFNFGLVSASRMVEIVCGKASASQVACVVSRNSHHVGRLGGHVQKIAERGFVGFAVVNSSKHGHWVVPWGGREGRLATNPLAFAAPTNGLPVVLDMSTAMISEGKIRVQRDQGKSLPPNSIQDAEGNVTTDPNAFYGPPRGTIRPFGSELGYKGFGLGLMVEILGGILAGAASSEDLPYINGLSLTAINPEAFCGLAQFKNLMNNLCAYATGSPLAPGFHEVVMPGALDFRMREKRLVDGIPVPIRTWQRIKQVAGDLGVKIELSG